MRIAILNSWPNLEYSAEREFIARFKRVCLDLEWACIEVITSDDILAAHVDCVISTHEFSPKLTGIPTIGMLWNPPIFFRNDPLRIRSILSYDGYLAGSNSVRTFLEDLIFSTTKNSPISDWDFVPTAPSTIFRPPNLHAPSLFYAGVHWDGDRHGKLIKGLCESLPMAFYGDPLKWAHFGEAYKGRIPFDGVTIFDRIHDAGVALCLHRDEHLSHGVPSMRIFESAAAGAVIITENSNFAQANFGDSVLYVDQAADESGKIAQIRDHFNWILSHPRDALELAKKSNSIFNEKFSLQRLLVKLPAFLQEVRSAGNFNIKALNGHDPKVECIVRIGSRAICYVDRCLESLAAQSYSNIGLVLVSFKYLSDLDSLIDKHKVRFKSIKRIDSEDTGSRSTALWDGMRALDGEYFCNLDDDDTIHSNHIASLVELLESNKDFGVAYSGAIQVQDEVGHHYHQVNFDGPIGEDIKENRKLIFFDQFERQRFLLSNFILSNSFLARRSLVKDKDLVDPKLVVAEDVYLYLLFLRYGDFLFSWKATANWHWRSTSKDNSMFNSTIQAQCHERLRLRTKYFNFLPEPLTTDDVLRPFVTLAWSKYPLLKRVYQATKKFLHNSVKLNAR